MTKLSELLAQKASLEQQIAQTQRAEKASAIADIKALMAQHGLTLADLGGRVQAGARKATAKVPPKYRHPKTGNTWSGRGLQPNWLKAELASGARIEDFKV